MAPTLAIIRRPDDFSDPLCHFQVQGAEQAANGRKHAQNAVRTALQPDRYDECAHNLMPSQQRVDVEIGHEGQILNDDRAVVLKRIPAERPGPRRQISPTHDVLAPADSRIEQQRLPTFDELTTAQRLPVASAPSGQRPR